MQAASSDIAEDAVLIADVVREAGALALDLLRKGVESWEKSPGQPVTEADIAVNDLLESRLMKARPGYGWLSEESRDEPSNRSATRTFVVDPIDGTRAFIRGEPGFSVSVARLEGGRSVVGAVFNPMTDELFLAAEGAGATLNGAPVRVSSAVEIDGCSMIVRADVRARLGMNQSWPDMKFMPSAPNSIAYRMALVASGRWDAAIGASQTNDWDVAAAAIILAEAGGRATDGKGEAFVFNQPDTRHTGVVASGANLHPLLIDRLAKTGPQT